MKINFKGIYTASQPIRAESLPRKALQPRPDKPGHTAERLIRAELILGIPPIRTHLSFKCHQSGNSWAPPFREGVTQRASPGSPGHWAPCREA